MGDFFSALFGGNSPGLTSATNNLGSLGGFSSNVGQGDTSAASAYYNAILSGDPAKIAQALAPQIAANTQGAQEKKQTMADFSSRSGGNQAAGNEIDANTRAELVKLIGGAQQGAAAGLGNLGTANLGLAGTDLARQGALSEEELQNQNNSIFGNLFSGIGGALGKGAAGGLGLIPGLSAVI